MTEFPISILKQVKGRLGTQKAITDRCYRRHLCLQESRLSEWDPLDIFSGWIQAAAADCPRVSESARGSSRQVFLKAAVSWPSCLASFLCHQQFCRLHSAFLPGLQSLVFAHLRDTFLVSGFQQSDSRTRSSSLQRAPFLHWVLTFPRHCCLQTKERRVVCCFYLTQTRALWLCLPRANSFTSQLQEAHKQMRIALSLRVRCWSRALSSDLLLWACSHSRLMPPRSYWLSPPEPCVW